MVNYTTVNPSKDNQNDACYSIHFHSHLLPCSPFSLCSSLLTYVVSCRVDFRLGHWWHKYQILSQHQSGCLQSLRHLGMKALSGLSSHNPCLSICIHHLKIKENSFASSSNTSERLWWLSENYSHCVMI